MKDIVLSDKAAGTACELMVAAELQRRGFSVSLPFGENQKYDLVADGGGKFLSRIQVKGTATLIEKGSRRYYQLGLGQKYQYNSDNVDFIVGVILEESPTFLIFPIDFCDFGTSIMHSVDGDSDSSMYKGQWEMIRRFCRVGH